MRRQNTGDRRGMALLTVLLLVAVMAVVCVLLLDQVRFSVRRATNLEHQAQMQGQAAAAEAAARHLLATTVQSGATGQRLPPAGQTQVVDLDNGQVRTWVGDGQVCFNLNSLVFGQGEDLRPNPQGAAQLVELGTALGLSRPAMVRLANALTDWMDSDQAVTAPGGAEDADYATRAAPYRTAGLMLADVTELRAVAGVSAQAYERLRPYVCALPEARLTRLNLNSLTGSHAPLLMAISGGQMTLGAARAALASRPAQGWSSPDAFWALPVLNEVVADDQMRGQSVLASRYFRLRIEVDAGDSRSLRTALIHVPNEGPARTVIRRWTPEE